MKMNFAFFLCSLSALLAPFSTINARASGVEVEVPKPRVGETVMYDNGCVGSFQGAFSDVAVSVNWSETNDCGGGLSTKDPGTLASISPSAHAYGFHVNDIIITDHAYRQDSWGQTYAVNDECVGTVKGIFPDGKLLVFWKNCGARFGIAGPDDGNTYLKSYSCHDVRSCLSQMNSVSSSAKKRSPRGVSTQKRLAKNPHRSNDGKEQLDGQGAQSKAD